MTPLLPSLAIAALALFTPAFAYIPAIPTNDTSTAIADGLNVTDTSRVYLQWYNIVGSPGEDSQTISYQLVGPNSDGISKGALVRFSEENATQLANDTTATPWIALVSCDGNATHASQEFDIFTLANDRGAVGALLYSEWSQACIINAEYLDPDSFDPLMDIFSTQSLISARVILGQFEAVNVSTYGFYNPALLNASQSAINDTLQAGYPTAPGYMWATLAAYNATAPLNVNGVDASDGNQNNGGSGSSKTTLAMVILYAITGCIAGLFAVVIITGVIRAVRHPERYRLAGGSGDGGGQGRGGVLTRAILDTFPLIKFGARREEAAASVPRDAKDLEAQSGSGSDAEMPPLEMRDIARGSGDDDDAAGPKAAGASAGTSRSHEHAAEQPEGEGDAQHVHAHDVPPARPRAGPSSSAPGAEDPLPEAIGRETCPICIVDFDDGDDVRVLPCEGKHVFHQACVDPWLLELSSSCPICRHDFQALETLLAGGEPGPVERRASQPPRFSRYLRFARRRHMRRGMEVDPTDPPAPLAPGQGMAMGDGAARLSRAYDNTGARASRAYETSMLSPMV
ncbi:hypothetical protein BC834DRAFT_842719 [Gloeopeniophorella convolvens]|nr:hypothetical protein BC834DRAFT_842719 [Gloeopeniophorella convolvens]